MAKKSQKLMKKKIKKIIFFLVIFLIIGIVCLSISKLHSKEHIVKRLLKGIDNLNYTYTIDDGKTTVQVFGKYEKITNSNYIKYVDYENKSVNEINPNATVEFRANYTNKGINEMDYYSKCISFFDSKEYKYTYKGKKDLNGNKCTIIDFENMYYKYRKGIICWINDSLNVLEKIEYYYYPNGSKEMKIYDTKTFNFHTNSNKLEDVKIPDDILKYPTTIETGG